MTTILIRQQHVSTDQVARENLAAILDNEALDYFTSRIAHNKANKLGDVSDAWWEAKTQAWEEMFDEMKRQLRA